MTAHQKKILKKVTTMDKSHMCNNSTNKVKKALNILPGVETLIVYITINYINYYKWKIVDDIFYLYVKE